MYWDIECPHIVSQLRERQWCQWYIVTGKPRDEAVTINPSEDKD